MAKRVNKSAAKTKQTAAAKRTKKTKTPVKKTPVKKTTVKKTTLTVINGNEKTSKTPKKVKKTAPPRKNAVSNGKKRVTTKTTLAEVAKGAQAAIKPSNTTAKLRKNVIRLKETAPAAKFTEMGDKIKSGEVKWVYYATDGNIGYHHYEKLK